jgi:sensor histidine kinase YesM
VDDEKEPKEGLGLRNASERLRLLFGPAAKLELDLLDPARAVAKVRLPT